LRFKRFYNRATSPECVHVDPDVRANIDHDILRLDLTAEDWQLSLEQSAPPLVVITGHRLHP